MGLQVICDEIYDEIRLQKQKMDIVNKYNMVIEIDVTNMSDEEMTKAIADMQILGFKFAYSEYTELRDIIYVFRKERYESK